MKERIEVMFTAEEITKRLEEIAQEVYEEFGDEQVEMVCVLKGGVVTLVELAKKMKMPVTMNFMDVSSYGDGTESSGHIKILRDLDEDITGKNVLLVEDIIDSGRTLSKLRTLLIQSLSSVMSGTVQDSENRLARMDFKIAVELSKLCHVIAYTHDVDEAALSKLHLKCLEEVRHINGAVEFEDAYKYQKREV